MTEPFVVPTKTGGRVGGEVLKMQRLRSEYDRQSRPIIRRLDEIAELKKRYVELPDELKQERRELQDKWFEIGTRMYEDFCKLAPLGGLKQSGRDR